MKRVFVYVVLGVALLATGRSAAAEHDRGREPRWSISPQKRPVVTPLDLARWLARRLDAGMTIPLPVPSIPPPPVPPPGGDGPDVGDEVCTPERVHCPIT